LLTDSQRERKTEKNKKTIAGFNVTSLPDVTGYTVDMMYIFSGGTWVTVSGLHLDSVAEPNITLTVVVSSFDDSSVPSNVHELEKLKVLIQLF